MAGHRKGVKHGVNCKCKPKDPYTWQSVASVVLFAVVFMGFGFFTGYFTPHKFDSKPTVPPATFQYQDKVAVDLTGGELSGFYPRCEGTVIEQVWGDSNRKSFAYKVYLICYGTDGNSIGLTKYFDPDKLTKVVE